MGKKPRTELPKARVRGLMKKAGATIVSEEAQNRLIEELEMRASQIGKIAQMIATHSGRKRPSIGDTQIAVEYSNIGGI